MPIGQVRRWTRSGGRPRARSRLTKRARLVSLPIRPRKPKSPRRSTRSQISRSSGWLWVITTKKSPAQAAATASAGAAEDVRTVAGSVAGKSPARPSIHSTRKGKAASAWTSAAPTWPAPKSCRRSAAGGGRSKSQASPAARSTSAIRSVPSAKSRACWRISAGSAADPIMSGPSSIGMPAGPTRRTRIAASSSWLRAVSQPRSPAASGSNSSRTLPPQHCPSSGPSAMVSLRGRSWAVRAAAMAANSRWPPPIDSATRSPWTSIRAPASRGAEPWTATTVTSTAGSPAAIARRA